MRKEDCPPSTTKGERFTCSVRDMMGVVPQLPDDLNGKGDGQDLTPEQQQQADQVMQAATQKLRELRLAKKREYPDNQITRGRVCSRISGRNAIRTSTIMIGLP